MKKGKKIYFGIFIIISLVFISYFVLNNVKAAEQVSFSIVPDPLIDIVLASKETNLDLKNFENDIKSRLASKGVDRTKVQVQTVETKNESLTSSSANEIKSSWTSGTIPGTQGSSAKSDDFFISNNRLVRSNNYTRPASGYYNKNATGTKDATFQFEYGIDSSQHGTFDHGEAGFMFRMQDSSNFYCYIMDNYSACGNIAYDYTEALAVVRNGSFQVLATHAFPQFYAGLKQDIKIVVEGNHMEVWRENAKVLEANDSTYAHGTYGFYVWDQYGAYFSNISSKTEVEKDFNEVIQSPNYRDNSLRILVNVNDKADESLKKSSAYNEAIIKSINEGIHLLMWGNSSNEADYEKMLVDNDGKGLFINNSNYEDCIEKTAQYIKDLILKSYLIS